MTEAFIENNDRIWTRRRLCLVVKPTLQTSFHIPDNIHAKCDVTVSLNFTYPEYTGMSRGQSPLILSLCTRWSWMVNVTLRPFWLRERIPLHIEIEEKWTPELVWMWFEIRKTSPVEIRTLVLVSHSEATRPAARRFSRFCTGSIQCLWSRWYFKMQ
jgi:hypothetical protein